MSSGESPGTAGKLRRFGGGRFGDGVVPRARVKLEKSSTIISVVDDWSVFELVVDVATDLTVVLDAIVDDLVVVVVLVVVEVVVGADVVVVVLVEIRIRGRFRTPVASFGRLSETWLLRMASSEASSTAGWGRG